MTRSIGAALIMIACTLAMAVGAHSQNIKSNRVPGNYGHFDGSNRDAGSYPERVWAAGLDFSSCERLFSQNEHSASDVAICIVGTDHLAEPIRAELIGECMSEVRNTTTISRQLLFSNVSAGDYVLMLSQRAKTLGVREVGVPTGMSPMIVDIRRPAFALFHVAAMMAKAK